MASNLPWSNGYLAIHLGVSLWAPNELWYHHHRRLSESWTDSVIELSCWKVALQMGWTQVWIREDAHFKSREISEEIECTIVIFCSKQKPNMTEKYWLSILRTRIHPGNPALLRRYGVAQSRQSQGWEYPNRSWCELVNQDKQGEQHQKRSKKCQTQSNKVGRW